MYSSELEELLNELINNLETNTDPIINNIPDHDWNEERMDICGQNGNDGLHYPETQ